ncbi:MAG TPA: helix-turn-helix domain-containing protein [Rubrobacter sp.]|nr:helix-turn-helix domain-containing protein [Rubrobacter sp.]
MEIYTSKEYAEKLNVSEIWVRELARKGRIYPSRKVGRNWVFFGNSTVIRPPERWNRQPKKMKLPHSKLTVKQMRRQMEYALEHEHYSKVGNIADGGVCLCR